MMACEQMNRVCCMMELDEKYASVILRRAVENGILRGNAEGDLMLSQSVTREQLCTMLYRFARLLREA